MKHLFIINPKAGKGEAINYKDEIEEYFKDKGDTYEILITEGSGHATEYVKRYDYSERCKVYAIGGDGTLNEVLNGLIGKDVELGIIPAGSGNDFVKTYLGELDFKKILSNTIEGTSKEVDIGYINNRYFMNISSIGFDAHVANNAKNYKGNMLVSGPMAYILGAVEALIKFKSQRVKFIIDDIEFDEEMFLIAAANGKYYGGGMVLAPDAEIVDGLLDVYGVKKSNPYKVIRYLKAFLTKNDIKKIEETYYYKCKRLKVISEKEIISNIDGEIVRNKEFNLEIIPKGIKLIIPKSN